MNTRPRMGVGLALILLLYLTLGVLFAICTPPWQAPDEPAHYNYVRFLTARGDFPVLQLGDYPHAYLEQIKAAGFPPNLPIEPIRYEFHQPPLYYLLVAPIYALTGGSVLALRLCSVLLGAGIVCLAYAIGRRVLPGRPTAALAGAAFVAFLPQHLATVSQVGNDVLAELLFAAALYLLVGWVQDTERGIEGTTASHREASSSSASFKPQAVMGILLGLILIAKTTAYIALPLAAGVLIWRWRQERAGLRRILAEGAAVALPAAFIALPWYVRNIGVYGWPDFLGLLRHDQIVVGQMRTVEYVAQYGWPAYWRRALEWTFKSFWGVFGWMAVWLDSRVYLGLAILSGIAAGGHLARRKYYVSRIPYFDVTPYQARGTQYAIRSTQYATRNTPYAQRLLAISSLLTLLSYAWYNTQFLQHQGRYLFMALIPIALAFAVGWEKAVQPGSGIWMAAGMALTAIGMAAWGVTAGPGLPRWPMAILMAAAVGAGLLDLMQRALVRQRKGESARLRTFVSAAALAFPYAFLLIVGLYALFREIVGQLG